MTKAVFIGMLLKNVKSVHLYILSFQFNVKLSKKPALWRECLIEGESGAFVLRPRRLGGVSGH